MFIDDNDTHSPIINRRRERERLPDKHAHKKSNVSMRSKKEHLNLAARYSFSQSLLLLIIH